MSAALKSAARERAVQTPVWKALADPTRRAILDHLRDAPRTTGDLADEFDTTRFAVMKHLAVLEGAGLIVSRRSGRERWNHLNSVPLQRVYERWVKPYEAHWAAGLLQLERHLQSTKGTSVMTPKAVPKSEARVAVYELEIKLDAPRERVWKALTHDVGKWWRKDFYVGKNTKSFILEPKVGGRLYEDWGNGEGLIWYTVTGIESPWRMWLSGSLWPEYGGPASSFLSIALEAAGKKTVLKFSDALHGRITPENEQSLKEGWQLLLGDALKSHVESAAAG